MEDVADVRPLLDISRLDHSFDHWLSGNAVMKRTFQTSATIAGLIDRRSVRGRTTGRQALFSSDILYDTLRKYQPDHLLLQITREEARKGLVDFGRLSDLIAQTTNKIDMAYPGQITPFAAPLFLEIGKVPVQGAGAQKVARDEADRLMREAGLT